MKKVAIIVFGKNVDILETVVRLINEQPNWEAVGTTEVEVAIAKIQQRDYQLLLLGGGISPTTDNYIRTTVAQLCPLLKVVQHFGGGSGLLYSEIQSALFHDETSAEADVLKNE